MFDVNNFASKSAKVGVLYPCNHFALGWKTEGLHRMMGNEMTVGPSPKVQEAVKSYADKLNWYPEDDLTDENLREHLADYIGMPGRADWITCGNGSMEIIDMVYESFVNEGDELIISTPDYTLYTNRALLYGGVVKGVYPKDLNFTYDAKDFTDLVTDKTKLIMISRPNNPDGHMVSRELVEACLKTDVLVVVDEAYFEFGEDPIEDLVDTYPNLIISHTCSKAMGLAGIRLGWILARPEVINVVNKVRQSCNVNLIAHVAAIAAIDDREYIQANVKRIIADRELFFNAMKEIPGMRPIPSSNNFVMVDTLESGIKASDIQKFLLDNHYLVRNWIDSRGLPGDRFFRVTIGTHEETTAVIDLIKKYCAEHGK